MSRTKKASKSNDLLKVIIEGIQEVKGQDILELDLRDLEVSICDTFVICHGNSTTQVDAIKNKVEEFTLKELKQKPWNISGSENSAWIILDYFDIIVHVFQKDVREMYKLEDLWSDAKFTSHENLEEGIELKNNNL